MIEYILCYSTAFFLGMASAFFIMWVSVVMFERKGRRK